MVAFRGGDVSYERDAPAGSTTCSHPSRGGATELYTVYRVQMPHVHYVQYVQLYVYEL